MKGSWKKQLQKNSDTFDDNIKLAAQNVSSFVSFFLLTHLPPHRKVDVIVHTGKVDICYKILYEELALRETQVLLL